MIWVNFKTYQPGSGQRALQLAKICQAVSQKTSIKIIPVVQGVDLFRLASQGFEVWAQHLDDIEFGPNTGQVLPEAVAEAGAKGTLLNHSECKLPMGMIHSLVKRCRQLKMRTLVCAESLEEGQEIVSVKPNYLAYEPPEFIGSRTDSVSSAKPEVIQDFVKGFKKIPVLVGAGIHSQKDVQTALQLGAKGILVATEVVLAKNPEKELTKLAKGFLR
jgi:triosephosphate isomerase